MRIVAAFVSTSLAVGLLAALPFTARSDEPAPPPEVKKTTDSLVGHWTFTGTGKEPGAAAPSQITGTLDCEIASLGAAVACRAAAEIAGVGRTAAATVVGYNPDEHVVHWMEISSTGEYHDHKGPWTGNAVKFEPLPFTVGGEKMTEYFHIAFPAPGKFAIGWTMKSAAGDAKYALSGTRAVAPAK